MVVEEEVVVLASEVENSEDVRVGVVAETEAEAEEAVETAETANNDEDDEDKLAGEEEEAGDNEEEHEDEHEDEDVGLESGDMDDDASVER